MDKYHKGYIITHNGYKMLQVKNHPNKDSKGYVREHILVVEKEIGRFLNKGEVVHHIDGNKLNNNIENLKLMSDYEHRKLHSSKPRKQIDLDLVVNLLKEGYTMPQVADKVGMEVSGLRKRLKKENIQLNLKCGGARRKIFENLV